MIPNAYRERNLCRESLSRGDIHQSTAAFRRQYILGPEHVDLPGWRHESISRNLLLSFHSDLGFARESRTGADAVLLGYALDPHNPLLDNAQVVRSILEKSSSSDELLNHTKPLCGRYVIILRMGHTLIIFSDACGLRQVFYCRDTRQRIWCAAQSSLIARQLHLTLDPAIQQDLLKTRLFARERDYSWYPAQSTPYREIQHLPPNHFLNLHTGDCIRYWPRSKLAPPELNHCADGAARLLTGIFESAGHRFKNMLFAISSGLDSRLLLAASRKWAPSIQFFTHLKSEQDLEGSDVKIPQMLLPSLGLQHTVIPHAKKMDETFAAQLQRNVTGGRLASTGMNAFSIHEHFGPALQDAVVIYGNASEVTKRDRYRWPDVALPLINGAALTEMAGMTNSSIALQGFSRWLDALSGGGRLHINILDLMHWEQRVGNWLSMTLSEYDIAFESLCPFACREYIELMLAIPFKYRTMPQYVLHHAIIKKLWPEVLQFEISTANTARGRVKKKLIDLLYTTHAYDYLRYAYFMLYKRFKPA